LKRVFRVYDPILFWLAAVTTAVGMFFVFDAGFVRAVAKGSGTIPPEFRSQLYFVGPAILLSFVAAWLKPETWQKVAKYLWVFSLLLLVAVAKFGTDMNGAKRWLGAGSYMIQPAEFTKIAVVVYLAYVFANRKAWPATRPKLKNSALWVDNVCIPKLARCWPAVWVLLAVVLIEKEPDLGTAAVVAVTAFAMFWAGGVTRKTLAVGLVLGGLGVGAMVKSQPYRLERIENHWSRWDPKNVDDATFQTDQAELHIADGGVLGVGIANGHVKHILPATTTDFIMATVGEETGLLGSLVVLGLIGGIVWRLLLQAQRATSRFQMLVLFGVAAWFGIQACVNVMMANAFLPAIGIPLPFISSGGSSLVALWMALGICQSAIGPEPVKEAAPETGDHRWRNGRAHLSGA